MRKKIWDTLIKSSEEHRQLRISYFFETTHVGNVELAQKRTCGKKMAVHGG